MIDYIIRNVTWLYNNIHSFEELKVLCTRTYVGKEIASSAAEASFFVFNVLWFAVLLVLSCMIVKTFILDKEK